MPPRVRGEYRATWTSYREALAMFLAGATVRSAGRIALVVGTWLSAINQGDRILEGSIPWVRIGLNYATPFTVASLGFLAARRRSNVERLIRELHHEEHAPGP
jgi:hypothetical protein